MTLASFVLVLLAVDLDRGIRQVLIVDLHDRYRLHHRGYGAVVREREPPQMSMGAKLLSAPDMITKAR
jgi:hypothetical protein